MKKIMLAGLSILLFVHYLVAQSTTASNIQVGLQPRYLGFSNNFEVRLRSNSINRMITAFGGTAGTDGRIAFGNNLPNGFVPEARLHLHQTEGIVNLRLTTTGTGSGANDGFQILTSYGGNVDIINHETNGTINCY